MVCTHSGGQLKKAEEMDLRGRVGERGDHPLHPIKYRVEDEGGAQKSPLTLRC
jgi:hypothetical protein